MAEHAPATVPVDGASSAHNSDVDDDDDDDDERARKPYIMSQELFDALTGKGFSANAAKKSIVAGCVDEATCTQWIMMHKGHAELDTPLADGVEVVVRARRQLSEEERAAAVRVLQAKIARKKAEAKAEERRKELERIEFGRQALEARAKMEEVRRELELRQVRAQKQADAEARRRVKIQILADRYVRQGMSSDEAWRAAEAEHEAAVSKTRSEAAAAAATAAQLHNSSSSSSSGGGGGGGNATTAATPPQPPAHTTASSAWNLASLVDAHTGNDSAAAQLQRIFDTPPPPLPQRTRNDHRNDDGDDVVTAAARTYLAAMRATQPPSLAEACTTTVRGIVARMRDSPFDVKLRTLKTTTKAFTQKLLPVPAALQLLHLCNFDLHTDEESGAHTLVCTTVVMCTLDIVCALLDDAAAAAAAAAAV